MTWEYAIPGMDAGGTAKAGEDAMHEATERAMDEQAFAAFYQRTARPLWAYLARASGSGCLADDLMQESFVRFLCSGFHDPDDGACRRYLFRIATNLLHDHWRRPDMTAMDDVPEAALPPADDRGAEKLAAQLWLEPALARMKPRERQLLWLAYAEGATHKEIAAITGLRSASIRLLLFRARHKLERMLREKGGNE